MTTTNPATLWLRSTDPAELISLIGGSNGPHRERLEKWAYALDSLWHNRHGCNDSISADTVEGWLEYLGFPDDKSTIKNHESASLLRCLIPVRACPECEGIGNIPVRVMGETDYDPCKKCGGTDYRINRPGGDGLGLICEPPEFEAFWRSSAVIDLAREIVGKEAGWYCDNCGRECGTADFWCYCGSKATRLKQQAIPPDFSRMPFLADALMDAGCDSEMILSHCRDGTHTADCWVIREILRVTQ